MSQNVTPILSLLRLVAILGTAVVLLWHVVSMPELQRRHMQVVQFTASPVTEFNRENLLIEQLTRAISIYQRASNG